MDYKKIIAYLLVILAGFGIWYGYKLSQHKRLDTYRRFADLYSRTTIMAQVYRTQLGDYRRVRDSLMQYYGFTDKSFADLKKLVQGREEDWTEIWSEINRKTDSLAKYYQAHPIKPPPPPPKNATDSTGHPSGKG